MKKVLIALAAVLVVAAIAVSLYLTRPIEVFGSSMRASTVALSFDAEKITSFDDLLAKIGEFPFAKCADLGDYPIYPEQAERLRSAYPGIAFRYQLFKDLCGVRYPADCTEIDLSNMDTVDVPTLISDLSAFDKVSVVTFGAKRIKVSERDALVSAHPDIRFQVVATYDVCGKEVREDCESLDLTDVTPDETLAEQLSCLKNLKSVDLHGVDLSQEEKLKLIRELPHVEFGMTAVLAGQEYETSIETLDLNKKKIGDLTEFDQALALFPKLTKVEMCGCGISNEDMAALCESHPSIKFAWRVYLGQWSLRTDDVAFSVLIVNYKHKRLRTPDVQVLKYCPDLQALDLGHQALTDLSWIPEYVPELRILILADNAISDLTPLAQLKHLHYLEFFVNRVTDVTPLAQCKELVDLNISYNPIRDVTALYDLPIIERLWLESIQAPAAQVNALKQAHPNATVINVGSGSVDQGWRTHQRYYDMIQMYYSHNYIAESFSKYDGLVFQD